LIFLSHQHQDKDFVGDIAQTLKDTFGEENIFYDSWSIKPGENIVEQMNSGLESCKYFFFFITENSLRSEMVRLEWTSTLMQRANRDIQFIPVRAENVDVPMVISSLKYLDLYNHGLEVVKTQMFEIISGEEKENRYPAFKNLQAHVLQDGEDKIRYFISVKRFFEPNSKFIVMTTLGEGEADLSTQGLAMTNYIPNIGTLDDKAINGYFLSTEGGIHTGFRLELTFSQKVNKSAFISLYHVKTESTFEEIPTTPIQSVDDLPRL